MKQGLEPRLAPIDRLRLPRSWIRVLVATVLALGILAASYNVVVTCRQAIQANSNKYYRATNATLGFQKIFVLNMPQRRDRRQNMSALARFHALHLTYAQTVDRHEADALAAANRYLINDTHLACYLSHLRVYQRMVRDHIETALILEDDVDVELDLKPRHAAVMREVGRRYGRDWDMLYLGHCTRDSQEPASSAYVSLYEAGHPMCLHAYAVTRECARRLAVLLEERLRTVGHDIDLVLAVGAGFGVSTVLGTSPPYMVQIGRQEVASDLTLLQDGDTAQRLHGSTLFHLRRRSTDPRTLPAYIELSRRD